VNFTNLETFNVTDMTCMFNDCMRLTDIDLSRFKTSNVTKMKGMFKGCAALETLNVNEFDMTNVEDAREMFSGCKALTTILCNKDWTKCNISKSTDMFKGCTKLIGEKGTAYDAEHLDAGYARPDGGTESLTQGYFSYIKELYTVFKYDNKYTLTYYYDEFRDSREGKNTDVELISRRYSQQLYVEDVNFVVLDPSMADARLTSPYGLFYYDDGKDDHSFHLPNVVSIEGLEYLNTESMTDMSYMFAGLEGIKELNLSHFKTDNVTNMHAMFYDCKGLTSLDLSPFNTDKVTDMGFMFSGCGKLTSLDLSPLNTANVTDMTYMFKGCGKLTSLDLSTLNTANVTDMSMMFYGCGSLISLDLTPLNIDKVTDMGHMFEGCNNLQTLYCDRDWSQSAVLTKSWNMFAYCNKLVGGKGTKYTGSYLEKDYARPDGGPDSDTPGYFTLPPRITVWYTVTYLDWDMSLLGTEQVEEGHDAKGLETDPEREGYTFTGWSSPLTNITSDLNVHAQYEKKESTGIEDIQDTDALNSDSRNAEANTAKHFRNGILYINRNGILYDAAGNQVQ
jgi:uncharacterized repeat protein (TIGR02543 family)